MNLEKFLSQTSKHEIWNSHKGYGSALCFDMGAKIPKKDPDGLEYVEGDICLWIYCCDWQIKMGNQILCDSSSSDSEIAEKIKLFIGTSLVDISKASATQIKLGFKSRLYIILSSNLKSYAEDDDYFTLYVRESNLSYNQKNGFVIESRVVEKV